MNVVLVQVQVLVVVKWVDRGRVMPPPSRLTHRYPAFLTTPRQVAAPVPAMASWKEKYLVILGELELAGLPWGEII